MSKDTKPKFEYPENYNAETGVYTFLEKVEGNGQTLETVTLRRFKYKELKEASAISDAIKRNDYYLKKSTGMATDDLDEVDGQDIRLIKEILDTFL